MSVYGLKSNVWKNTNMKYSLLFVAMFFYQLSLIAQQPGQIRIGDRVYAVEISECGDTLLTATLNTISVSSPRSFANSEEYRKYQRYRRAAAVAYPYAVEAIRLFRVLETYTDDMRKGKRRKFTKELQEELEKKFEDPLKKLTRTQGFILTKMIERELNISTFDVIKELRGGFTATYWNTFSRFFGYRLKEAYKQGEDPILDAVLGDYNIAYSLPTSADNKWMRHILEIR